MRKKIRCSGCGQQKEYFKVGWCRECYMRWYQKQRDLNPSEETKAGWIYADALGDKINYPAHTERGGKWLVFIHKTQIDHVWEKIKTAIENGELGDSAKVSTARPAPTSSEPDEHVICVYTYDSDDIEDVRRIRQELRDLGITRKISYKTDRATREGKYRVRGHKRISKYFE